MTDCPCRCHGFAPPHQPACSVLGGCGHLHRDEVTEAKFRLERQCRMGHGGKHAEPVTGLLCLRHAADARDLLADVHDLMVAYAEGDAVNPTQAEHRSGKNPHAPIPIRINAFLIGNPGGDPVESETEMDRWLRFGNPTTGRLESNGPDAPDVRSVVYRWADRITQSAGLGWPAGDTLGKLDFLRQHLAEATILDDFPAMLDDLRACRRALAAAIGESPGPVPLGKCPDCNAELFTDRDREVQRRRRAGEPITGEDAAPYRGRADRVACHCGASWEGAGLTRLRLILHPNPPQPRLEQASEGNGWMAS